MMKKTMRTISAIIVLIVVVTAGIFIWKRVHGVFSGDDGAASIAIIGGEDGPTSVFLAGEISDKSGGQNMGYTQINMDIAKSVFEVPGDYIILDVRRADEYAQGHIKGAINVANEEILDADIAELPNKDQTIYVYCRSGNRSKQAAEKLVKLGYKNIIEFGGIIDWKGDIEK